MAARATLRLGLACNNRCIFCGQRGLDTDERPISLAERLAALQQGGADEVTFVGGEPTLDGDGATLLAATLAARATGLLRVGVQTNGRLLAAQVGALADAGLTDVHVSLHGAAAAIHDYHTGVPGSFEALLGGVRAARAAGVTVVATTLVTRSSFRTLAPLPPLLRALDVAAWALAVPHVAGGAAAGFDRVVPRLGLAVPYALHAARAALRLGLPTWLLGAPRCALGPFAGSALSDDTPRAFAPRCQGCPSRAGCSGVDARYLERFGDEELHHVAPLPSTGAPEDHPTLRRLFVGAGELAVPAPATATTATTTATANDPPSLVQLGRVRPARTEVSPSAPRRSGESLREILPGLFGGEKP